MRQKSTVLTFIDKANRRVMCEYSTDHPGFVMIGSFKRISHTAHSGNFSIQNLLEGFAEALQSAKDFEICLPNGRMLAQFPVYLDSLFREFLETAEQFDRTIPWKILQEIMRHP